MKYNSSNIAFLLIDGYSVLGVTTDLTEDYTAKTEETTPLGAADETHAFTGLLFSKMSQSGFFDDAAGSSHATLVDGNGLLRVVCYGVEGNTAGKNFVGFSGALQTQYRRGLKVGDLHKASADYVGSGAKNEGKILHAHGAETTVGNTQATGVDNAASSATGAVGYLEVSALTLGGYTNAIVTLQDSADNITFADISGGAFTANTAAPAAQRLVIAGTIRRYTFIRWAYTGAGTGQSITFMAGIVRT